MHEASVDATTVQGGSDWINFLCSMRGEGGHRKYRRGVFPALSTGFSSGLCGLPHVRCYFFLELSHTTKIYDPSPIEAKSRP